MMNLTLDIGNTRVKWALYDGDHRVAADVAVRDAEGGVNLEEVLPAKADRAIVCATGKLEMEKLNLTTRQVEVLSADTQLPVSLDYATPHTLGPDRIAAACGAWKMCQGKGCVIVDAGTCITIDYIDPQGIYRGGAILPGFEMKFRALNTFTAKLPLCTIEDFDTEPVTGRSTQESILAGVLTATRYAVEGFVAHYRQGKPETGVLLTGGDANWLWGNGRLAVKDAVWEPYLVMNGLNEILTYNEKK